MSNYLKPLPIWNNEGLEPPQGKQDAGWQPNERPASEYMNWLFNAGYEAIKELQENAVHKDGEEIAALNKSDEKIADISKVLAENVVYAENFPYIVPESGTDDLPRLQRAVDSANGNCALVLKGGKQYKLNGSLEASGTLLILANKGSFISTAPDNTAPMIKNKNNSGLRLTVFNGSFTGANVAIENTLVGAHNIGLKTSLFNCYFQGNTRKSKAINLRQNDFTHIAFCEAWNYDTFFHIESDWTTGERDNTQIHLFNLNIAQCNLALYLRQVDKSTLTGVDVSRCGSGIYFARDNKRVNLTACHIEFYGDPTYKGAINYGYGYYLPDDQLQPDITFDNCTTFLPLADAVAGVYLGQSETLLTNVIFENCFFDHDATLTNHRAVRLYGSYVWRGRFPYDNTSAYTYKPTMTKGDGLIEDTGNPLPVSRNLLPFSLVSSNGNLWGEIGTGTIAITNNTDGVFNKARLITIAATGSYERYARITLKKGWHTLLLKAYKVSGSPYVYVQNLVSPYNTALQVAPNSNAAERMVRVPFFVQQDGDYKIGITASGNCSLVMNQIEVVRGFGREFTDDNTVTKTTAPPTTGYADVNDKVINTAPSAGGYTGWVNVAAGSPGTWKGYGAIQA